MLIVLLGCGLSVLWTVAVERNLYKASGNLGEKARDRTCVRKRVEREVIYWCLVSVVLLSHLRAILGGNKPTLIQKAVKAFTL